MEIVFPCHLLLQWGLMEMSMNFHGFGGYLCCWRIFVLDTPPKSSIFGHLKIKADQLTQGEGYGRAIDLVWRSRPYAYIWKNMCFWRSRLVIWPPWLKSLSLSFWFENFLKQHLICDSLIQNSMYFKINQKRKWEKMLGIKEKQCLQWAQVWKFYLLLRLGY